MKQITLNHTGYILRGLSVVTLWGGGDATTKMDEIKLPKLRLQAIREEINDGGFGVQDIRGAIIDVYSTYEKNAEEHIGTILVDKSLNSLTDKDIELLHTHYEDPYWQ